MFAHIANLTNFGVEDMSAFINSLGTAPTKIGRPLEEMLAMGGLLSNIGQQRHKQKQRFKVLVDS